MAMLYRLPLDFHLLQFFGGRRFHRVNRLRARYIPAHLGKGPEKDAAPIGMKAMEERNALETHTTPLMILKLRDTGA